MTTDCVFCKIAAGTIPATILYQDELVTAFHDIQPQAPVHILIVPNRLIATVNEVTPEDEPALGRLFTVAARWAFGTSAGANLDPINSGLSVIRRRRFIAAER